MHGFQHALPHGVEHLRRITGPVPVRTAGHGAQRAGRLPAAAGVEGDQPAQPAYVMQVAADAAHRADGMALGSAVAMAHALIYNARFPSKLIQVR